MEAEFKLAAVNANKMGHKENALKFLRNFKNLQALIEEKASTEIIGKKKKKKIE